MKRPFITAAVVCSLTTAAQASGPIRVSEAWSRPAAAGLPTGVAYLMLTNGSASPDRLQSASSPKAARVGLHQSVLSHGVMSMEPVQDGLALPPGRAVALAPNGYHLMLMGLRGGLKPGERYPLVLHFAHAKPVTVQVQVRSGSDPMAAMARR